MLSTHTRPWVLSPALRKKEGRKEGQAGRKEGEMEGGYIALELMKGHTDIILFLSLIPFSNCLFHLPLSEDSVQE